jgi:ubiquinone/menaquinone biosynthesis C-methylase UbiE
VAYDAISKMLSTGAKRRALEARSIDRVVGLAEFLPFTMQSFNAVLSFNAVHHFDLVAFLHEAARVLQPNGQLIIYTRTPDQNRRTIWGQFFPHFIERETRLYTEDTLRAALDATDGFEPPGLLKMPWMMHTSLPRLLDQARKGGYSTFQFFSSREFDEALRVFEIRVRASFDDPAAITVPNDHLLMLATHTAAKPR